MRNHENKAAKLPLRLDLSAEILPAQTLVEIFGTDRVVIENHKGIVQYDNCQICVKKQKGFITVIGKGLNIARMSKEQLVIIGCIERVCF